MKPQNVKMNCIYADDQLAKVADFETIMAEDKDTLAKIEERSAMVHSNSSRDDDDKPKGSIKQTPKGALKHIKAFEKAQSDDSLTQD